eukprot:m.175434 g.175434  ORF g.175434 m.175434 type:complete len:290 (+) comp18353_c0_seq3:161-1030(+)
MSLVLSSMTIFARAATRMAGNTQSLQQISSCTQTSLLHTSQRSLALDDTIVGTPVGELENIGFEIQYSHARSGVRASPWHDVPLRPPRSSGAEFNFINEIPRYTTAKMEISTKTPHNPIIQDTNKDGTLRHYAGPLYWNYGCIPQTWEDPSIAGGAEVDGAFGDNDPLDVVEIGSTTLPMGSISTVKILGALSMLDGGELDWKLIAVHTDDPLAKILNDIADVDRVQWGTISGIREWFRWYKTPSGKPLNAFGHDERALNRDEALQVIAETHHAWQRLKAEPMGKLWTE